MTLAKPINKYIDYIDAPEDTFEQYVEKALKYNFAAYLRTFRSTRRAAPCSRALTSSLPAPSTFPRAL